MVRMNAGFELIWCDFSSPSIRVISHLNVTVPLMRAPLSLQAAMSTIVVSSSDTSAPSDWSLREREPFNNAQRWDMFLAASWHYGASATSLGVGEYRAKPLVCGMTSYYNPKYTSLESARATDERSRLNLTDQGLWTGPGEGDDRAAALKSLTRRRRQHTLQGASLFDAVSVKDDAQRVLLALTSRFNDTVQTQPTCSGPDWQSIATEISLRFAASLQQWQRTLINASLTSSHSGHLHLSTLAGLRDQAHFFLVPFLQYPQSAFSAPELTLSAFDLDTWRLSSPLGLATYSRCRNQYTTLFAPENDERLSAEDKVLRWAIEETLAGICRVVIHVAFGIERVWLGRTRGWDLQADGLIDNKVQSWKESVEELMAWLGWMGDWTGCGEGCSWDEKCTSPFRCSDYSLSTIYLPKPCSPTQVLISSVLLINSRV